MKPAPFEYTRPSSVEEACALLAADADARIIAGGQTLVPMMAMRLARPARLVDIHRISSLAGIAERNGFIAIGATTRQIDAERSALVAEKVPLLAKVLPWVGHLATRNRGTIGGSVANADPAAEIPLVLVTLSGTVLLRTPNETREIAAGDFFTGPMMTSAPAEACLTEVHFPVWKGARIGVGFHEVSARRSDFAYAAAAAQVQLDGSGRCNACAIGIGAVTPTPLRLDETAKRLKGSKLADAEIREALAGAVDRLDIMSDLHASPAYRRRVIVVLAERALRDARDNASDAAGRNAA